MNQYQYAQWILLSIIILFTFLYCNNYSATANADIDIPNPDENYLLKLMNNANIAGMNLLVLHNTTILYEFNGGYNNIENNITTDTDSIYLLASVSKTITAISVMQQVELGKLDLDININNYLTNIGNLPNIVNPYYPNDIITLRHLMTHTASIYTTETVITFELPYDNYTKISLRNELYNYLLPNGSLYTSNNWLNTPIGTKWSYSNFGIALCALIVEIVSGIDYRLYTEINIFQPLGMINTVWKLSDLTSIQRKLVNEHYSYNTTIQQWKQEIPSLEYKSIQDYRNNSNSNINWTSICQYAMPIYPAGSLRTTARSLSYHLSAFINYGELNGIRLLSINSIKQIRTIQYPHLSSRQGLIYRYFPSKRLKGKVRYLGHNGEDPGASTYMLMHPATNYGIIILTTGDIAGPNNNGNRLVGQTLIEIYEYLFILFENHSN